MGRAKSYYADVLGLKPVAETEHSVFYECADHSVIVLYPTSGVASGSHTQGGWHVNDIRGEVTNLRERGVVFEEYDFPNLKTEGGIARLAHGLCAWFKDTEGNTLSVTQLKDDLRYLGPK